MADLAKYIVSLEAQTARYEQKLDQANRKLDRFEKNNRRSLGLLSRSFKALGAAAVTYLGARGVFGAISAIADSTVKLQRFERGLRAATGSAESAAVEMAFVRKETERLGLNLESAADQYTRLAAASRGTALAGQDTREIFVAVAEASRVLGLSSATTGGALTAIEQIISKGKVSAEELRGQLGERLPGAFQIAARSIGVTTARLDEMLKKGELTAEDLLPSLAKELRRTFGPEVEAAATDAVAAYERFNTALFDLKVAIGESGLLDLLQKLADGITKVLTSFENAPIDRISARIRALKFQLEAGYEPLFFGKSTEEARKEIEALERQLKQIQGFRLPRIVLDSLTGAEDDGLGFIRVDASKIEAEALAELEKIDVNRLKIPVKLMPDIQLAELDSLREIQVPGRIPLLVKPDIELDSVEEALKDMETDFTRFGDSLGRSFQDSVDDAFLGIETSFSDLLRRLAVRAATSQLFGALAGLGGPAGTLFSFLGFGGERAAGGPVSAGRSYLVGERGPEIYTPAATGFVTPSAGGMMIEQHLHFDVGLESVDGRIAQAAGPLVRATEVAVTRSLTRARMA